MAFATLRTATCITCSSVFGDQDEDGAPEVPGQRCAIAECERWICAGGCAEHHSLHCRTCGSRVCEDHAVTRQGFEPMCRACADALVSTCQWCSSSAPVTHRYADGLGTCDPCHQELHRATRGLPDCPECGHRYWVVDMDERRHQHGNRIVVERPGVMYRCSCGLKFTREAAAETRKGPQRVEALPSPQYARM